MISDNFKRVVVFDDSHDALYRFAAILGERDCELQFYRRPSVDDDLKNIVAAFHPHLIIVDLVLGESREDGYNLIRQLAGFPELSSVPIIICSKLITDTSMGKAEKERLLEFPQVRQAFGKFPELPSADEMLAYAL